MNTAAPNPFFSPLYTANTGKRFYSGIAKVVFISILTRNEEFFNVIQLETLPRGRVWRS